MTRRNSFIERHAECLGASLMSGRREIAVLLLHGLTGTPADVSSVGSGLSAEGYTVSTPLLPGRGTCPGDMDGLSWEDWMSSALLAYDELARDHREIVVGGLSAGATMALDIALRRRPSALLLYGVALAVRNRLAYLAPYAWRVIRRWPSPPSDVVEASVAFLRSLAGNTPVLRHDVDPRLTGREPNDLTVRVA